MIEQEITVMNGDDPFDTTTIKVMVPKGTKLMSTEAYAADVMAMYDLSEIDEKRLRMSEESTNYITLLVLFQHARSCLVSTATQ